MSLCSTSISIQTTMTKKCRKIISLFFSDAVVWKYDIMLQVLQRKANL